MYAIAFAPAVDKTFFKLKRRDRARFEQMKRKIDEICKNPYRYKPLRGDLHGSYRTHIGSFVLVFEVEEDEKIVRILDFEHHDTVY